MKTHLFIYFSAFLLVFVACEEKAVAPELIDGQSSLNSEQLLNAQDKSDFSEAQRKGQKVLNFRTSLSGDEEVPAVETKARGVAIFQLSKDGTALYFKLIVANIENVTMAHIHLGPAGENGPAIVWLYPGSPPPNEIPGRTNGILAQGTITESDLRGELEGAALEELIELMLEGLT